MLNFQLSQHVLSSISFAALSVYISISHPLETEVHFVHNNYSWKHLTMLLSKSDNMQMNEATGQTKKFCT